MKCKTANAPCHLILKGDNQFSFKKVNAGTDNRPCVTISTHYKPEDDTVANIKTIAEAL